MLIKGTTSLEVKNSERNRDLENFASLELRVCEVLCITIKNSLIHKCLRERTVLNEKSDQSIVDDSGFLFGHVFLIFS